MVSEHDDVGDNGEPNATDGFSVLFDVALSPACLGIVLRNFSLIVPSDSLISIQEQNLTNMS